MYYNNFDIFTPIKMFILIIVKYINKIDHLINEIQY